jgi:hypothetical protein
MKLSKADVTKIVEQLSMPWGAVMLDCDGYDVRLWVAEVGALKFEVATYVNGCFKADWLQADCEERRRFMRPLKRYVYTAKDRKNRRLRAALKPLDIDRKIVFFTPFWPTAKAALNHIQRNNTDIKLLDA